MEYGLEVQVKTYLYLHHLYHILLVVDYFHHHHLHHQLPSGMEMDFQVLVQKFDWDHGKW